MPESLYAAGRLAGIEAYYLPVTSRRRQRTPKSVNSESKNVPIAVFLARCHSWISCSVYGLCSSQNRHGSAENTGLSFMVGEREQQKDCWDLVSDIMIARSVLYVLWYCNRTTICAFDEFFASLRTNRGGGYGMVKL